MRQITLGYSPCPNDTFIFYALAHGKIKTDGLKFTETLLDVETLNQKALLEELDVTKVSYHALGSLRDKYVLLRSGGAMGRGCGPLLVSKTERGIETLKGKRIAIPGRLTTAFLLLLLYDPSLGENITEMRFDLIPEAVRDGRVDAGLIIHESRFTYKSYGITRLIDLGSWWEELTGLPIPLGAIIAKRSLGKDTITKIDSLIRESVLYAMNGRDEPAPYIKSHARELDDGVIRNHIDLYVNDHTVDIGEKGLMAVGELLKMAEGKGIIKKSTESLLI